MSFFFFFFLMLKLKYKNKSSAKKTHTLFTQIPSLGEVYPICFILGAPFTAKSFSFLFKSLFIQLHCVLVVACRIFHICCSIWELCASLVAQRVKNLPAMQETPLHFLGWEDPLEKR